MRPEQQHYDTIEKWLRESIAMGRGFLFDQTMFRRELTRLWETYDVPYEVR